MPPSKSHKKPSRPSRPSHRTTLSLQKTEVVIHVYDLLTPGRVSSVLWHLGTSLLHSGVVINGKEYAYGGHDRRGVTGVYWTKPRTEPPGGTFRCEILQGFTLATADEIDEIIFHASEQFLGTSYNLLTKNCNHFTSFLCQRLTGRPGPAWLNRAASIGVALPCVVPREWIEPPEYDTADGELLLHDEDDDIHDERSSMLRGPSHQHLHLVGPESVLSTVDEHERPPSEWSSEDDAHQSGAQNKGKGRARSLRDAAGRALPPSERILN